VALAGGRSRRVYRWFASELLCRKGNDGRLIQIKVLRQGSVHKFA